MSMKTDGYWELFRETGSPVCWLLSRARRAYRGGEKTKNSDKGAAR